MKGVERKLNPIDIIDLIDGHRLISEEKIIISRGTLQFTFYKNMKDDLEAKFQKYSFVIPNDYKIFISKYSSAILYEDKHYGGGFDVLSPENVIRYWKSYSIDDPYYPIVWSSHSVGMICVNQNRIHEDSGYLTWIASMNLDNPLELHYNFDSWLEDLIKNEGKEFWLVNKK